MKSEQKFYLNTATALLYQFIATVSGFFLPRWILSYYGSAVNGLVSSILQFLSFISFMEMGVGAVVQSSLYKPLAYKDNDGISRIVASASKFFRRIVYVLFIYVIGLAIFFPKTSTSQFDFSFTSSLVLILSLSYFAEYYFGLINQLLLGADQKAYINSITQSLTIIVNTILCYILIRNGSSIHIVKLTTSILYIIRPVIIAIYIKRHYKVNRKINYTGEPIKQKWNGLAQHIASVVLNSTDICILTIFSTLENVSIYSVHALITNGVKQLVGSFSAGLMSWFGEMLAKEEITKLNERFNDIEWTIHTIIVLLYTACGILIVPFVSIYCKNIEDTNYYAPTFAVLLTIAAASHSMRIPYNMLIMAAGHYKQTQASAIIEAAINLILSVVLVNQWGLIGVAIGTVSAMSYRTLYFVFYLSKNIVNRNIKIFAKHLMIDCISVLMIIVFTRWIKLDNTTYVNWVTMALKVVLIEAVILFIVNLVFYKENLLRLFKRKKESL